MLYTTHYFMATLFTSTASTDHWVSPDAYQPRNPDEPKRKPLSTPGMVFPMHRALDQLARAQVNMSGGRKSYKHCTCYYHQVVCCLSILHISLQMYYFSHTVFHNATY